MHPFSTLRKQQKTVRFSVFKGLRKFALESNGSAAKALHHKRSAGC